MKRPYVSGLLASNHTRCVTLIRFAARLRTIAARRKTLCACVLMIAVCAGALNAQPAVFDTPHYQSPVRGLPGDLVMIPGSGFLDGARAFYQYAPDPSMPPNPPSVAPVVNTLWSGELDLPDDPTSSLDAYVNVPDSLTVKLPMAMGTHWPYAIHVRNADGQWSDPVFINDPRPQWVSPDFGYPSGMTGSSSRTLRVVGRNLVPLHEDPLVVRLIGPAVYDLVATTATPTGSALDHYVVEVDLPSWMKPGTYSASVMREGVWFRVLYGRFDVLEQPGLLPVFYPNAYGCAADDGLDDTACIQAAIDAAAVVPGGGVVQLLSGQWDLRDSSATGLASPAKTGLLLRTHVNLYGNGAGATTLVKHPTWIGHTAVTVEGHNEIRDIHFVETTRPGAAPTAHASFLRLGKHFHTVPASELSTTIAEHIVIHDCRLTGMYYGIGEGGFPLHRIHITDNVFHPYRNGLYLTGDPNFLEVSFDFEDSLIERNLFLPGAFVLENPALGTIATELGASKRMIFGDNIADGTVGDGWRAAFFWSQENNNEMLLVAENLATCTGDQGHDGEAIVFDGHRNEVGFEGSQEVIYAGPSDVEVAANWLDTTPGVYNRAWVVVVKGPGLGQARRIVGYSMDRTPSIRVYPPWDVIPTPEESEIVVTRAYWSTYVVENDVDNRTSMGCKGENPLAKDGLIGNLGWTFDSTIEGNRQYDSGGIHLSKRYAKLDPGSGLSISAGIYASEVRGNLLDGEPQAAATAKGGIEFWHSAIAGEPGIALSHNLAIAHNTIRAADGVDAAIGTRVSASVSTEPWVLSTIHIFRNDIYDVPVGIALSGNPVFPQTWRSVLQGNGFTNVPTPLLDNAQETATLP